MLAVCRKKYCVKHCVAYVCAMIYTQVDCTLWYVYDVVVKQFTFAISSPDELLVLSLIAVVAHDV